MYWVSREGIRQQIRMLPRVYRDFRRTIWRVPALLH
jgi:hypothetical protein